MPVFVKTEIDEVGNLVNKITIDINRCKGCYLCIEACPKNIIEVGDRLNALGCYPAQQIEGGECTACALCARVCPDAAIEVYRAVEEKAETT